MAKQPINLLLLERFRNWCIWSYQRRAKEARLHREYTFRESGLNFTSTADQAHGNGFATPEAVARSLGYTEKEQALAKDVLKVLFGGMWQNRR